MGGAFRGGTSPGRGLPGRGLPWANERSGASHGPMGGAGPPRWHAAGPELGMQESPPRTALPRTGAEPATSSGWSEEGGARLMQMCGVEGRPWGGDPQG